MLFAGLACAAPAAAQQGLPGTLDPDNYLARIARGELAAARLYEDDRVIAVLADRPSAEGHFLVWLKHSPARNLLEVPPDDLAHAMAVTQRVARATVRAVGAQGLTIRQNNGSASNIHQFHLHAIPRWPGDRLPEAPPPPVEAAGLERLAARIRTELASD